MTCFWRKDEKVGSFAVLACAEFGAMFYCIYEEPLQQIKRIVHSCCFCRLHLLRSAQLA